MQRTRGSAVVTGAGRGIGRSLALALAERGFSVALQARTEAQLVDTAREIETAGGRAVVAPGDVTQAEAAELAVERAMALGPLEVAVACAGQAISAPFLDTSPAQLRQLLEVNTVSAFHLIQATARIMKASKTRGRIVVVASTAAVKGIKYTAAYSASKHAVLGLVKSAALELARYGITVNALCPGWVDTPMFDATKRNIAAKTGCTEDEAQAKIEAMIPTGHVLLPSEVAAMLDWVISPAAANLTGQALVLDGGETIA